MTGLHYPTLTRSNEVWEEPTVERIAPGILIATLMLGPVGCGDPAQPFDLAACCEEPSGHEGTDPPPPSSAHIFLAEADGTGITMLVRGDWPSWSPDGRRVAFHRDSAIHVIDMDGSNEMRLIDDLVFWSFGYGIATVGAAGGQPTTVYQNFPVVAYGAKPVWSPAGTIAFTANADAPAGHRGIWIVGAGGEGPDVLIPEAYDPAWSPDGNRIAFARAFAQHHGGSP
jgi:hypothetical protein